MPKKVNRDDIDKFHDYGLYVPNRTIYMGSESYDENGEGGVDGLLAERIIKNINLLDTVSSEPITIIMNNVGGDEYHGFAIYDAIKCARSHVTVIVYGHAMSMGSIILQAADWRVMAPTARQMIHYGTSDVSGHAKTAQKWHEEHIKNDKWVEELYLSKIKEKKPNFDIGTIRLMLDHDTFFTAQESIYIGLADEVLKCSK
jgi:ATP-dependent protease ClpP protease subunit